MDSHPQAEPAGRLPTRKRRKAGSPSTPPKQPKPAAHDYVGIADAFAHQAIADEDGLANCLWIRLAASRYIKDQHRAVQKNAPFYFDEETANDACSFIEKLPHVEGVWSTPEIKLHPAHVFFIVCLFGFRKPNGHRRYTSALFSSARKNAKSTLAAGILLYCLCCENEMGAQVISAATTGSQARIVFNIAKRMVEMTGDLAQEFQLETFSHALAAYASGGSFRPINAKASTQDGLNPSHVCLDEIHAHKSHELLNVLQSASGARSNPLYLYTTTEGYDSPGPWPEMRQAARQVLHGLVENDHFLFVIFALDEAIGSKGDPNYRPADEDFDESKWIKANPLISVNPILLEEIRKSSIDAKLMPGRHAEFRIKKLNRQSSVAHGWTNLIKWRACDGAIDLESLKQHPCWGGLDLSATNDLTSFRLVWRIDSHLYTHGWAWVPRSAITRRLERGLVPYQGWVEAGWVTEAGDEIVDYELVSDKIIQVNRDFNLQKVGYDDWNSKQILKRLVDEGVPMEEFKQGPKSFHPAMKDVEEKYVQGKLSHGGDPVLAWCASNLVARTDVNMNTAPDKKRSLEKIDAMVALFMAAGISLNAEDFSNTDFRWL